MRPELSQNSGGPVRPIYGDYTPAAVVVMPSDLSEPRADSLPPRLSLTTNGALESVQQRFRAARKFPTRYARPAP